MALYQRKVISTGEEVGEPGPLPAGLRGLSDDQLTNLEGRGLPDTGFFPVPPPEPEPEPPVRWIHKALFKRRFTVEERIAIRATEDAEETPAQVRFLLGDFREVLDATDQVYLDDPDLVNGLGFLVTLGLLGEERPAEIRL